MPREPQNQISHDATSLKDISEDFRGKHKGDKEELWDLFRVQLSVEKEDQRGGRVYTETSTNAGWRSVLEAKDQDSQGANVSEAGSWVESCNESGYCSAIDRRHDIGQINQPYLVSMSLPANWG